MMRRPTILHADLDAFYASVEQLLDPSLQGRPIAVGGSVVLAASYEARAFGVHGAMPGWRAKRLCPDLIFVGGHFAEYQRLGDLVIDVFYDFTPLVERISIDEAFLDVSGAIHLFGEPQEIASQIRERVRGELGLPISVGVASTKHLAKIASQVAKPDGLVVVDPEREMEFLGPLPVSLMWGIGPVAQRKLADRGITKIGELAASSPDVLQGVLGRAIGTKLFHLAANEDHRQVEGGRRAVSMGAQSAFRRQVPNPEMMRGILGHLADRLASRLRAKQRAGRTVTVRVRFAQMKAVTRSLTLPGPISSTLTLIEVAERLVLSALDDHPDERDVTLFAISVSNLVDQPTLQLELPVESADADDLCRPGSSTGSTRWAIDRSMDDIRRKFGRDALGYVSVAMSQYDTVPDEFRELAERHG
jgi:DNA polymerase IV